MTAAERATASVLTEAAGTAVVDRPPQPTARRSKFAMIPAKLIDGDCSSCVHLFGWLDRRQGEDGWPWYGREKLAAAMNVSVNTVNTHAKHLEAAGFLRVFKDGQRQHVYWVENPARPSREIPADLLEPPKRRSRPHPGERQESKSQKLTAQKVIAEASEIDGRVHQKVMDPLRYVSDREGLGTQSAREEAPAPEKEIPIVSVDPNGANPDTCTCPEWLCTGGPKPYLIPYKRPCPEHGSVTAALAALRRGAA